MLSSTGKPVLWPRWWLATAAILFAVAPVLPIVYGMADWPLTLGAALIAFSFQPRLARLLPEKVDRLPRRRPVVTVLWLLLYLVGTFQLARLGAFHADQTRIWASTIPDPAMASHACMSAYVRAAELAAAGVPNLYAQVHWPVTNSEASRQSVIAGLGPALGDPYQYPPTFLLLFRFFDLFTRDYQTLRASWFLFQVMVLLGIYGAVARWIGRPAERSLWLFPAFMAAVPTSLDLQFGQVHLLAIAAALMGRVLLEKGRNVAGSLLIAAAIVTKLFPAVLLIELLARRRFRQIGFVLAAAALLVALGVGVLGVAPHTDFLGYQVPRLLDGSAFSFFEGIDFFVSRNISPFGIPLKLSKLGLAENSQAAASAFARGFGLLLVVLAWRFARNTGGRRDDGDAEAGQPLDLAIGWIALLTLGSLLSPLAPSAYVLSSPLWMLALFAARIRGAWQVTLYVLAWIAILGPPPLPLPSPEFEVGLLLQLFAIALPSWLLWRQPQTCNRPATLPAEQAPAAVATAPAASPAGG